MKYLFASKEDATACLVELRTIAREYGAVSVRDLDELVGCPSMPINSTYVWEPEDLACATIEADGANGKYVMTLPEPGKSYYVVKRKKPSNEETKADDEMVSHPPHYQSETGMEVIDVIEAFTFDLKGIEATDTGNIIKYACRWKKKGGVQDLKKILWYTNHLINHIENLEKEN